MHIRLALLNKKCQKESIYRLRKHLEPNHKIQRSGMQLKMGMKDWD